MKQIDGNPYRVRADDSSDGRSLRSIKTGNFLPRTRIAESGETWFLQSLAR